MVQYTLRNIPAALDEALRRRAHEEKRSLNEMMVEALAQALGFGKVPVQRRDFSDIAGTWKADRAFDEALRDQHSVDKELWK